MKVLIIQGHPRKESFNTALAKSYEAGAVKAGHDVRVISVIDMKFNALEQISKPEKDVKSAQKDILWADHIVFAYPIWWSTMPALVKGFIDRVFAPGVTYKFKSSYVIEKLLTGKTARVIVTMDAPPIIHRLLLGNPLKKNMKSILGFCGIKPVKYSYIGSVKKSSAKKREEWLNNMAYLASRD